MKSVYTKLVSATYVHCNPTTSRRPVKSVLILLKGPSHPSPAGWLSGWSYPGQSGAVVANIGPQVDIVSFHNPDNKRLDCSFLCHLKPPPFLPSSHRIVVPNPQEGCTPVSVPVCARNENIDSSAFILQSVWWGWCGAILFPLAM